MRRRRPERREILPDPIYNDLSVAKFMNYVMKRGKKGIAESIFYGAMDIIKKKTKTEGLNIFQKAIENVSPSVEVKSKRIGGATYQVPIEVPRGRKFYLASHWLINSARSKSGRPMAESLASELISAANNEGGAIKKKDDTHRMAEANKAFAHFR
ncbi:MAG: 30S ribosomal protein S7 [Candidatus Marinimicrobia bacterium]|jgi:small subunit ribosomal protein S7|nr:30S ribosomal protein S7 [Candidatus Neomarinimicrobiota bacterium]MBT3495972.1 30S ribosomal protein S7 [Candidatus Neomarinimicrobiota bacterium]MBT3692751.1 30S ribosomal protein S7 [Candidatus Neomarinimicrobiota bacterium]MBT3732311.1 30S ribosomal protein S7 [Candidatus Neomarinimicrobiota bacterium]MBT4144356.1 30S ribosomal protein S7 [Candidatus Neomarinimicrobiota bacterium]